MSAIGPNSDWAPAVVDFLANNLPLEYDGNGWDHKFSTAYQIGCEAFVALGQAEETKWGATPLANPSIPDTLPRWDDICVAVLWLAEQQNKLEYRLANGSPPAPTPLPMGFFICIAFNDQPTWPKANIGSSDGTGPAHADSEVLDVLRALGLTSDGRWSDHAETIFWREQPQAWKLDVTADNRFSMAAQRAVETIPDDICRKIRRLMKIKDKDVHKTIAQHRASHRELILKLGSEANVFKPDFSFHELKHSLVSVRRHEIEMIFFNRWRLPDGWLTKEQAEQALEIFHDPLAEQMRREVIGQLFPDQPEYAL